MITKIEVVRKDPSRSRWSCNDVRVTDECDNVFSVAYTHAELNKEQLRLKLIQAGADPQVLVDFETAAYNEGRLDECDANAGESM